ncbi:hypothetical protein [Vibrio navarrensis]|uniref:hypothetical protein n=1 Tax=Vibrio navarrensis TaxID=29495 RepID=UPI00303F7A85
MQQRLDLLLQASVISSQAHRGCVKALALLDSTFAIDHASEQYQMAITHLARAADRIWQQQAVEEGLDPEVLEEIQSDPHYPHLLLLHQKVLDAMGITALPASEESFLLANLYALMQVSKEPAL